MNLVVKQGPRNGEGGGLNRDVSVRQLGVSGGGLNRGVSVSQLGVSGGIPPRTSFKLKSFEMTKNASKPVNPDVNF